VERSDVFKNTLTFGGDVIGWLADAHFLSGADGRSGDSETVVGGLDRCACCQRRSPAFAALLGLFVSVGSSLRLGSTEIATLISPTGTSHGTGQYSPVLFPVHSFPSGLGLIKLRPDVVEEE
jgi:hypothetical protein